MKKTDLFIFSCALWSMAASGPHAATILCKTGFSCPMVENVPGGGSDYGRQEGWEGAWSVMGPWGGGNVMITLEGNSRCSPTSGISFGEIGKPIAGNGNYCWCQMKNGASLGAWALRSSYGETSFCRLLCASNCVNGVGDFYDFRSAICVPPADQTNNCDETTLVAENTCPAGYVKCVGSKKGSDAAGQFTITCSE
jgi:hypothetical protein